MGTHTDLMLQNKQMAAANRLLLMQRDILWKNIIQYLTEEQQSTLKNQLEVESENMR
jgi:hypothetical protein